MAWYKKYEIPFQSRLEDQYIVYIYEQTAGQLTTLTGSDVPFETQENDDDDIFTPIRKQTGYLRVIDETQDGSLLETLMPQNNTQKLVRLYNGAYVNGTFNDANLVWQGFLCAEAFTQSWDKQKKVIEFPVKSLIDALSDVSISSSDAASTKNIAWYINQAFTALGETPSRVNVISNLEDAENGLLQIDIDTGLFFDLDEQQNEGSTQKVLVGKSYFEILEEIAKLYGITFRMIHGKLYLSMYDNGAGKIGLMQMTWANLQSIANGNTFGGSSIAVPEVGLLESSEFEGVDNVAGFVQGSKEAIVSLEIKDEDDSVLELPMTTEDQSTSYEIGNIYPNRGQVFVQPHNPRTLAIETYSFYEYQSTGYQPDPSNSLYALIGTSNYSNCLNNSVVMRPDFKPLYSTSDHLHTGAFPCRWLYKKDSSSQPQYRNGLFLNQMFLKGNSQSYLNNCYAIESTLLHTLQDGYLHINMQCNNFQRSNINGEDGYLTYGEFISMREQGKMATTTLYFVLSIGSYYWDGSTWVTGSIPNFAVTFYGSNIKTNKTDEMEVDESDGWFIHVPNTGLYGKVKLQIVNAGRCIYNYDDGTSSNYFDNHSKIITDLSIDWLPTIDPMASRRTRNTYRQNIVSSGFAEDKEIDLSVGTNNNNIPSHSFIKSGTTLIETLPYYYAQNDIRDERPEKNLLARMVAYYGEVRRAFTGILKMRYNPIATYEILEMRYTYLSRKFFAVLKNRNWREDRSEVKFIEVT